MFGLKAISTFIDAALFCVIMLVYYVSKRVGTSLMTEFNVGLKPT